ncbi:uncharacterized protein MYCGRDRAFT_97985 [Zymoseptoria tritici IPO323]|uniref:Uncharacterized protein n=1 Tax=Zymoseptoria tritici (strain CBS 115943 / IPO323) TaxID=336722 RepID=F9XRZ5_ZYMTI|nr:uncharacterized protein MYCGRDRAFT_97985 [Zymoseptoria tritici IPO323]EGP82007.1 hypothetical protein MYCGRDRAFT_97985 [Zymoseptoria tritici IPO323]
MDPFHAACGIWTDFELPLHRQLCDDLPALWKQPATSGELDAGCVRNLEYGGGGSEGAPGRELKSLKKTSPPLATSDTVQRHLSRYRAPLREEDEQPVRNRSTSRLSRAEATPTRAPQYLESERRRTTTTTTARDIERRHTGRSRHHELERLATSAQDPGSEGKSGASKQRYRGQHDSAIVNSLMKARRRRNKAEKHGGDEHDGETKDEACRDSHRRVV